MAKTTLPPMWWPLMDTPDLTPGFCIVCGRNSPTEKHHVVKRSAGEIIDECGKKRRKPVFELCGFGNNLQDADGRHFCHGKAHAGLLYFRNDRGCVEHISVTPEWRDEWERSTGLKFGYLEALEVSGWWPC